MEESQDIEEVKALVTEVATERGLHDPQDAFKLLDDSVMITDKASAERAINQLAREHPVLIDPYQAPPPPPTPGHHGMSGARWAKALRKKPSPDQQMLGILKGARRR